LAYAHEQVPIIPNHHQSSRSGKQVVAHLLSFSQPGARARCDAANGTLPKYHRIGAIRSYASKQESRVPKDKKERVIFHGFVGSPLASNQI